MTFDDEININWYRSPIDRGVLTELMQRSDLRGWIQTTCHLGLFFVTAGLAYLAFLNIDGGNWYWSVPVLLLTLFMHGTVGGFTSLQPVHELQHRTVFKTRWLNQFFEQVYSFISCSDYIWYQQSHRAHHKATCHAVHDGEVLLPQRFSLTRFKVLLGLFAWNPQDTWVRLKMVWRHANGNITGDWYKHVLPESNEALRRKHRNWARILLGGHGLLALIFILTGHWFLIVVFTLGSFYCRWLSFFCGLPQHYGLKANAPDFRLSTRTFTCSWFPAFLYWNMQYHLEHHMYPVVPFYNLPKLRKAIEHDLPPAPDGLYATWQDMLEIRRKSLADPNYQFIPELPVVGKVETSREAAEVQS
ncbi:MAG: fatty acid desaturase [Pseudomonadota bacterium]